MGKYAHFENIEDSSLLQLYGRHAEIARDIHQDILRKFTGNENLVVDLVRQNPLGADAAMLDEMSQYDVMSVSTGIGIGAIINGTGLSDKNNVDLYRQRFEQEDMPVYVVAAGNEGDNKRASPRVADFSRTSLVVGEANLKDNAPYIEDHSSINNPTLSTDNPFNREIKYQYYDTSPSLIGHEKLIQNWLVDKELSRRLDAFLSGEGQGADENAQIDKYWEIKGQMDNEGYGASQEIQDQVRTFMANPQQLHSLVMAEIRENKNVDDNGYTSEIDGTSFSAPEQAGYISGAMYEQEQREEANLPILMKEEISTLIKLATSDVFVREGQDERLHTFNNNANFQFTEDSAHGVFNPEMFRKLLDEAYKRIENNPDIDRETITAVMSAEVNEQKGDTPVVVSFDEPVDSNIVIERTRLDIDYFVNGTVPQLASIQKEGQGTASNHLQTSTSSGHLDFTAWSRSEIAFGEIVKPDDAWEVNIPNGHDTTLHNMSITVYGYNAGGLMDQMMAYSKEITPSYAPQLDTNAPTQEEAEVFINDKTADDSTLSF